MNGKAAPEKSAWRPPRIGQRIVKTAVAVFICVLIYHLFGYSGRDMPTESCITAIICMQPYVQGTRAFAFNRFAGTLIGAGWGLLFLLLVLSVPVLHQFPLFAYVLMGFGVLAALYTSLLVRKPDISCLSAIVFACIALAFREADSPVRLALGRIVGVLIGTAVAIAVNIFRLPRRKNDDAVFFIRTKDIVPDRFSQIPPAALFRLNYLFNDGAKICLISEHAPAFFNLQVSATKVNVPLIVMDGAALYDASENVFLEQQTIDAVASARFRERMEAMELGYFIYTIHKNKTCIFRRGEMTPEEKAVYDRMKRSPYRSYLDGDICAPEEIVYFKLIAADERIAKIRTAIADLIESCGLRTAVRPQPSSPGVSGLYIYSGEATVAKAEARLMAKLRAETGNEALEPVEVFSTAGFRSEDEAVQLTHRLENIYAPVCFFGRKKKA